MLERLSKSNVNDPHQRRQLLEHADAFIADGSYWRLRVVAVAAAIDDDADVLARVCAAMGHHAAGLGAQAVELLNSNNVSAGLRLLKQVVRLGNAPLTAFNNLAWALLRELGDVDEARQFAALCEQHGPQNPSIFHNTACVWVRLGDHERALAAVHAAVRYHYEHLEKLRVDDDLLPIRHDPRFSAAFAQTPTIDPDSFTTTTTFKGEIVSLSRLVLRMDFFLPDGVPHRTGPALARVLEVLRDAVPAGALGSYYKRGPWGRATKATWTRAINTLREADGSTGLDFRVHGPATSAADESGGPPSPFGVVVDLWPEKMDGEKNKHPPTLSMWFPVDDALRGDVEHVIDTFRACVEAIPCVAASCGLQLLLRDTTYVETWWESHLLKARAEALLAQERHPFREWEDNTICGAQWLTFADDLLVERCGGADAVRQASGAAQVVSTSTGLLLRASLRPGLGQSRPAEDLGALPSVARAFAPVRIARKNMRVETIAHYARFDDLADTAFENGPPSGPRMSMPTLVFSDDAPQQRTTAKTSTPKKTPTQATKKPTTRRTPPSA